MGRSKDSETDAVFYFMRPAGRFSPLFTGFWVPTDRIGIVGRFISDVRRVLIIFFGLNLTGLVRISKNKGVESHVSQSSSTSEIQLE